MCPQSVPALQRSGAEAPISLRAVPLQQHDARGRRNRQCDNRSFNGQAAENCLRVPGVRLAVAEMAGPVRRLRRMELGGRGAGAAAGRRRRRGRRPPLCARRPGRGAPVCRDRNRATSAADNRHRRIRPRARRRRRSRIARAARRRAGHRQVDTAPAGGGEHGAQRPRALQLGRGVGASNQSARRAARGRQCAALPSRRNVPRADPRGDRAGSGRRSSSSTRCRPSSR